MWGEAGECTDRGCIVVDDQSARMFVTFKVASTVRDVSVTHGTMALPLDVRVRTTVQDTDPFPPVLLRF